MVIFGDVWEERLFSCTLVVHCCALSHLHFLLFTPYRFYFALPTCSDIFPLPLFVWWFASVFRFAFLYGCFVVFVCWCGPLLLLLCYSVFSQYALGRLPLFYPLSCLHPTLPLLSSSSTSLLIRVVVLVSVSFCLPHV